MEGAWGRIPIDVGRAGLVFQEQTGREGLVSCMCQKGRPPGDPSRAGHGAEHWWCILRSGLCHQAKEAVVSVLKRPPVSTPRTTKRHRPDWASSG